MNSRLPSEAGVLEAAVDLAFFRMPPDACTTVCHNRFPVPRSQAMTDCEPVVSSEVAMKTRSPTTVGEPKPRPGISTRQRRFLVSSNSVGGCCLGFAVPFRRGPRHQGQSVSGRSNWSSTGAGWLTGTAA